jgi:3-dehydroquinate synthase
MKRIALKDYEIVFANELDFLSQFIKDKSPSAVFVLVDANTEKYCLPVIENHIKPFNYKKISIAAGEENKHLGTCEIIWKNLLDNHADRKALMINLGGGVIGDMGGFAASCYKRGIDFINIPTTVLSQVDASIGGKLAVDFKYGKNLIGLFRNPGLVFISTEFYQSLSEREYKNGFAEIFKHALIRSKEQWEKLSSLSSLYAENIDKIIFDSVMVKKEVVEIDPFEKGLRKILNFGHTIGHAVEAVSIEESKAPLFHGEAVVVGMICEAFLSTKQSTLTQRELTEIIEILGKHFTKYDISLFDREKVWNYMLMDKKNEASIVQYAGLNAIGEANYNQVLDKEAFQEALDFYQNL